MKVKSEREVAQSCPTPSNPMDCSLPGSSVDSILKSRDVTLPTEVHLVKAMVFPVFMYGCESWIIKLSKEELMLWNCGVGEDS